MCLLALRMMEYMEEGKMLDRQDGRRKFTSTTPIEFDLCPRTYGTPRRPTGLTRRLLLPIADECY
jgi:hypothetical protein